MLETPKKHDLSLRDDDRPSRFLVDLKKIEEETRLKAEEENKNKLTSFYERVLEYAPKKKEKFEKEVKKTFKEKTEKLVEKNSGKVKSLAIVELAKFLFFVFYKFFFGFYRICYRIGWYLLFGIRFVYFFGVRIVAVPVKLAKRISGKKVHPEAEFTPETFIEEKEVKPSAEELISNTIKAINEVSEMAAPSPSFKSLLKLNLRPALYFAVILIVLILPFKAFTYYKNLNDLKGRVLGVSEEAMGSFVDASKQAASLDFDNAHNGFSEASNKFLEAEKEINSISGILSFFGSIIPNKELQMASYADLILESGRLSAEVGGQVSQAMSYLSKSEELDIKEIFSGFYLHINTASQYLNKLRKNIESIDSKKVPDEYREKFLDLKEKTILIDDSLSEFRDILEKAKIFLGMNEDKRYLLIFQNNAELRASGGFLGSYALVDFRNGKIKNLEAPGGGSYDTEGGLHERVIAPEPLWLVNPLWHFWDANWWPDWPMSARKLQWFYEKSGGPTVDGVISLTPTVIERMLEVIGPIDMTEDYGLVFDAENFWLLTQDLAERKPEVKVIPPESATSTEDDLATSTIEIEEKRHEPKKIIGDLLNKIIDEMPKRLNQDVFMDMTKVLEQSFSEKHLLFYFNDEKLQEKVEEYGWDGKVRETAWDYLMVVNTNIGGKKSDRRIEEEIKHKTEISEDGSIINTIVIKRTHKGWPGEAFVGARNVDWMRVYVPLGSKLIEARGFEIPDEKLFEEPEAGWDIDKDVFNSESDAVTEPNTGTKIYNELGKTVFANWSQVDPRKSATIYLRYRLPFKLEKPVKVDNLKTKIDNFFNPNKTQLVPYALLVQKQPGAMNSKFTSQLALSSNFENIWVYPENERLDSGGWEISREIDGDKFFAALLEPR